MPVGIKLREQYPLLTMLAPSDHAEPRVSEAHSFGDQGTCLGCDQAAVYFQLGLMDGGAETKITLKIQESHDASPNAVASANWVDVAGKTIEIGADAGDYQLLSIGIRSSELSRRYWRWLFDSEEDTPAGFIGGYVIGSSASYNPVTITTNSAIIVD